MSNKSVSLKFFETYGNSARWLGGGGAHRSSPKLLSVYTRPLRRDRWTFAGYKQLGYAFLAGFADLHDTVLEQIGGEQIRL